MAAQKRHFEARPEQLEMARAIAHAAREKHHLLVEAGTGTGKSYAYLVPLIIWALETKKRVMIATGTKALQQQLVERDLPFLHELFKTHMGSDIKFALCLGTGNYVCPRRLAKTESLGLFGDSREVEQLQELHRFSASSPTGRNVDLPFEPARGLWAQVNRESDLCLARNCPHFEQSFYWKARREQEKAQILVANHHLLFAHIAAGGNAGGVLPAFDALVIDEAHHAEDVAASYLGLEISNLSAAKLIELLSNRKSGKTVISAVKWPERGELESRLNEAATEAREAVGRFFENLQVAMNFGDERSHTVRITRPNVISDELEEPLQRLETILESALRLAILSEDEELSRELEGFANRCAEMRRATRDILGQTREGYVYWTQSVPRLPDGFGKAARVPRLSLHGAPIEVAQSMRESVWKQFKPTILTSATLTTGGSFDFLVERLGLVTPPIVPDDAGAPKSKNRPANPRFDATNRKRAAANREFNASRQRQDAMNQSGNSTGNQANATDQSKDATSSSKDATSSSNNPTSSSNNPTSSSKDATNSSSNPTNSSMNSTNTKDNATNSKADSTETEVPEEFDVRTLTLGSPFDYPKNALIYVAADLPDPSTNVSMWEQAAIKRAAEVVKRTEGRAFILCTSYRLLDQTAQFLERVMPKTIRILRQGEMARGKLLSEFRKDTHSVLVGTTSFWQGVDVPGESLSCVVIMKLPFAVPDEPMVQARVETIKERGQDAFVGYQVPQAVMMFRQGFGRLIRTATDRGIVAILDPRVKTKPYGRTFLESLPDCNRTEDLERISLFVTGI